MTPEIMSEVLWSDSKKSRGWAFEITLEQMWDSIEGKVNCTVWQRLNQKLLIKRHLSTKSKGSRTSPFSQPVDSVNQIIMKSFTVAFEVFLNMIEHSLFPILVSIVEIPLIAVAYNANIAWSRDHVSSRLVINKSISSVNQFFSNQTLGLSNFSSFKITNQHYTFMETFLISFVFCLLQKLFVILALYLQSLAKSDSCLITNWSLNERDRLSSNHLFCNSILLTESLLISEIASSHPIIRGITRHTCNNSCSFFHWDGHHRKSINSLVYSVRSTQRQTN